MQSTDIPTRYAKVFAAAAAAGFIRTVPVASQIGIQDGAASFTDGFVPDNFQPIASGGVPPYGQDFNGLLKVMTAWEQWLQAGGPIVYNSAFSTAIGGYPKGAQLDSAATVGLVWTSTVENNAVDPDAGPSANWIANSQSLPIATALETQTGTDNTKVVSPKGLKDGGFKYIVAESLINNGGYRAWSDGFIECWGFTDVPPNSDVIAGLPYPHTAWMVPTGSGGPQNSGAEAAFIIQIILSGGVPIGFKIRNNNSAGTAELWWHTRGK